MRRMFVFAFTPPAKTHYGVEWKLEPGHEQSGTSGTLAELAKSVKQLVAEAKEKYEFISIDFRPPDRFFIRDGKIEIYPVRELSHSEIQEFIAAYNNA